MSVKCRGCGGGNFELVTEPVPGEGLMTLGGYRCLECRRVQLPGEEDASELAARARQEREQLAGPQVRPFVRELAARGRVTEAEWAIAMSDLERSMLLPHLDDPTFLTMLAHVIANCDQGSRGTYPYALSNEYLPQLLVRLQRLGWGWRYQLAKDLGVASNYGKRALAGDHSPGLAHELFERYERIRAIIDKRQNEPAIGWLTGFAEVRDEVYPDTELARICREETEKARARGVRDPDFVGQQQAEKARRARLAREQVEEREACGGCAQCPGGEGVTVTTEASSLVPEREDGVREYVWVEGQPCEVFCSTCGQLRLWGHPAKPERCAHCRSPRITLGPVCSAELSALRRGWQMCRREARRHG